MRILVADDHPLVRKGFVELVRSRHDGWDFSEAENLEEAIDGCLTLGVDLAMLDLNMPGVTDARSISDFRQKCPKVKVVILTGSTDRNFMRECFEAGVHGFMLKSAAADHLLRAIEVVVEGGIYLPSALAGSSTEFSTGPVEHSLPDPLSACGSGPLTGRQRQVLELLSQGWSTKEIARRLNLGVGTVKVHLAGVYKGLGARNRMEAVVKAGRVEGLASPVR